MKGIIKLNGKITGIAPSDSSSVNIRMQLFTYEQRSDDKNSYQGYYPPTLQYIQHTDSLVFNYQGSAHLSQQDVAEFAFGEDVKETMYGYGENINNLFVGDEIEVYMRWRTTSDEDTQHIIITHTVVVADKPTLPTAVDILSKIIRQGK